MLMIRRDIDWKLLSFLMHLQRAPHMSGKSKKKANWHFLMILQWLSVSKWRWGVRLWFCRNCCCAIIVFARATHTHTRGRHHLWRPQWTFSRSRPFFRPLVTSWFGRVGQVGGRKKPRREDSLFISLVLGHLQMAGGLVVTVKGGQEIKCCPIHQEWGRSSLKFVWVLWSS